MHSIPVPVVVKHRFLGGGRIWMDGRKTKVRRDVGGWYVVEALHANETARVRYDAHKDRILAEQSDRSLWLAFHEGESTFVWQDVPYHVGSMIQGEIRITQDGRPVMTGVVTTSGVRLDHVATEILPVVRALAWGLALRSEERGILPRSLPRAEARA